jgi:hypothetical protein
MNSTTTNSMNFLLQRNDDRINSAIPKSMRNELRRMAAKKNMSESSYIKWSINNQLNRDLTENS